MVEAAGIRTPRPKHLTIASSNSKVFIIRDYYTMDREPCKYK